MKVLTKHYLLSDASAASIDRWLSVIITSQLRFRGVEVALCLSHAIKGHTSPNFGLADESKRRPLHELHSLSDSSSHASYYPTIVSTQAAIHIEDCVKFDDGPCHCTSALQGA
jgi:hypothetical protein